MSCYIITYDLVSGPSESRRADYDAIKELIKSYGTWAKITESCYAIVSEKKASEVRDHIKTVLRSSDRLFVLKSSGIAAWSNVICRSTWLKEKL